MRDQSIVIIEAGPDGRPRRRSPLHGRRLVAVCVLALAEVVALLVWRPGILLGSLVAVAILALAVVGLVRSRPGLWRDVLTVVAGAQALIVLVPALLAASLLLVMVVAVLLVIALVAVAVMPRAGRA